MPQFELNPVAASYDPALADVAGKVNSLNQQKAESATLSQMAADLQAQQEQDAKTAQGNGQQMNPMLARLAQQHIRQMQLAAANPNNAANMAAAQAANDPYASMKQAMDVQQQKAEIAQKEIQSVKFQDHGDGTGTAWWQDPSTGQINQQVVGQPRPMSEKAKEIYDLQGLQSRQNSLNTQAAPAAPVNPNQPPSGAAGNNFSQSLQDKIKYSMMTPDQQKAQDELTAQKAKSAQEADQDIINTKAATGQLFPTLNQLDSLNNNPNLPSVLPESQADASNALHGLIGSSPNTANAFEQWNQTNGGKLVGGIKAFTSSATGTRLDLPVAHALMEANGITLSGSKEGRASRIQQARIELYNANIIAQNRAAQYHGQPGNIPTIPLNFKGKIYTMSELQNASQVKNIPMPEIIKRVQSAGSIVVQ